MREVGEVRMEKVENGLKIIRPFRAWTVAEDGQRQTEIEFEDEFILHLQVLMKNFTKQGGDVSMP